MATTTTAYRRRFLLRWRVIGRSRYSGLTVAALACIVVWLTVAACAPLIVPYGPLEQHISDRLLPPSPSYWLGTDPLGRDILSRIIYGAGISIPVGLAAVLLAVVLGTLVGTVSGFFGGLVDGVVMRFTDLMLAFPTVILAMVITAALGAGIENAIIALMIAWWPIYARLVRGLVLAERERDYVSVARTMGASRTRLIIRHILPNITSPVVIVSTLDVGRAILTFATLSFLGLGAPPTIPEWGAMVALGESYFDQWWIGTFPGIAILSVVMAINILGDGLRDLLDPQLRRSSKSVSESTSQGV
jgi:peptide/nickel transport system permease protein